MVIRVCGAIIREDRILMVRHEHDGREYWTLPGGGVEPGEALEEAAVREVREETGLDVTPRLFLFDHAFGSAGNQCRCFLMEEVGSPKEPTLGHDPEQADLPEADRTLKGIAWHTLRAMKDDLQVSSVIEALDRLAPGP